jgi:hypothetical protein
MTTPHALRLAALTLLAACADEAPAAPTCAAPAAVMGRVPYHECATGAVCPRARVANDATRPAWRLTWLRPTAPAAVANAAVEGAINERMANGTFLWAMSADLAGGTFRTGSLRQNFTRGAVGLGLLDGRFGYYRRDAAGMGDPARYDPVSTSLTVAGDRFTTGTVAGTVRYAVFNPDGSLFTELPLTNLRVSGVALSADRGCVGAGRPDDGRFSELSSPWNVFDDAGTPYGTVEGDISAADARTVSVYLGGASVPLCDLLAGSPCGMPMAMWPKQPDAMVAGAPGWHLRASFAAVAARVAP